jgi:RND family efflux transporter MFP subunit
MSICAHRRRVRTRNRPSWVQRALTGALAVGLGVVACGDEPAPEGPPPARPIKILKLGAASGAGTLEYPGKVSAAQHAEMAFEVDGRIIEFPMKEGQRVEKGALLARLDPRDYQDQVTMSKAERDRAQAYRDRVAEAAKSGAVSKQDMTDAEARLEQAASRLSQRDKALDDTYLKAPFAGLMAKKLVEDFQNVKAKEAVLVLQDTSTLEIKVDVPERDLRISQRARGIEAATHAFAPKVVVTSFPDRVLPARFKEFSTTADEVTRTFRMTLAFDNPREIRVLPGMTAKAILSTGGTATSSFAIPANAVVADEGGGAFVWRVDPATMKVSRAAVEVGELSGSNIAVTSGLSSGDEIAISGVAHLRDGMQVRRFGK